MRPEQVLHAYVAAFVDALVAAGVRDACVAPGSRSTPLALMLAADPRIRVWVHYDERSAAFFGLGMAKLRREPVALLCTSGSAAANFMPAVVEARYGRVPLVVLTADRPPELQENGAAQTIDQVRLYGVHAKWFAQALLPEAREDALRHVRTLAARACATAVAAPAGPVHLNFPFREPLVPVPGEAAVVPGGPGVAVTTGRRAPQLALVERLAGELGDVERGLIVCGPQDDPALAPAMASLATALGYPVLADPLSGVRCGRHDRSLVVDAYDALLRDSAFVERMRPEVVLRFGALPTSKPVLQLLERYPSCRQIVVDEGWSEPTLLAAELVQADAAATAQALGDAVKGSRGEPSEWASTWMAAQRRARQAICEVMAAIEEPFEGRVFAELAQLLPDGATLYAGNSMPVRDLDTFFPGGDREVRLLANRGANGIDGVVSSALGAAAAGARPLVLAIGDLSFYHDLNGLLAAKLHGLDATIVLLNNDGGGIFSFLPQAGHEHFEQLFGTPHGLEFQPAVEMYGGRYLRARTWTELRSALCAGLTAPGLKVIEMRTERARNVELHRRFWPAVARAVCSST